MYAHFLLPSTLTTCFWKGLNVGYYGKKKFWVLVAKTQFLDHEIFGLNKNENFERKIFDGEKYVFKDIWILAPKILLSKYFQNDLTMIHN